MLHISIVFGIIFLSFASGYAPFKQSKSLHSKLDPVLQARNIFQAKEKPSAPVDVTRKSPHFFSEDYLKGINLPNKLTYARALSVPLFALTFSLRLVRAWGYFQKHFLTVLSLSMIEGYISCHISSCLNHRLSGWVSSPQMGDNKCIWGIFGPCR